MEDLQGAVTSNEVVNHEDVINAVGYQVAAVDGPVGQVDLATAEVNGRFLVVDVHRRHRLGRKHQIGLDAVSRLDHGSGVVYVGCTMDEIQRSPSFDPAAHRDEFVRHDPLYDQFLP